eukprot:CAMPEP_0194252042 /NCGR_PEP_ID=MMETSP0158-20130606/26651_1 /TAXON_ID=33649 /ORGANISM="Thalassionema nitzschioides, Strain L26-B" /LENGTH=507 /DNA_ID=CAMNT_0038989341 /DNA_START=35 /DNA_END=1558 /DNA_ORIENTATION=-
MLTSCSKPLQQALLVLILLLLENTVLSETQQPQQVEECRPGENGNGSTCKSNRAPTPQRGLQAVLEDSGKADFQYPQYGVAQDSYKVDDEEVDKLMIQGMIQHMEALPKEIKSHCKNIDKSCLFWASIGECKTNSQYMTTMCAPACQSCTEMTIDNIVQYGYVTKYGVEQKQKPKQLLRKMAEYMENVVWKDPAYEGVRSECRNKNADCMHWARLGECDANPQFMKKDCGPSCLSCDYLDINLKCPFRNETSLDTWKAGDLNQMFLRIVQNETWAKKATILSMPHNMTSSLKQKKINKDQIVDGPWVITLSDFATPEECDALVELAHKEGFETSKQAGKEKHDGSFEAVTTQFRTSSNTWCTSPCYDSEVNQAMLRRIEELTKIPFANYEHFQLLQYHEGQYYKKHHDLIDHHIKRNMGVRILTVFFYLSDDFDGGGTSFPSLDLTVTPKKGTVLIWPSVYDELPNTADFRTEHTAMVVTGDGVKYAANAWVHQRDFLDAFKDECHL